MSHKQYAGCMGYYGASTNPDYNKKSIKANKLVDEYNKNIALIIDIDEQFKYQSEVYDKIDKILNN